MMNKLPKILHATRWLNLLEIDGWTYASRRRPGDPPRTDAINIVAVHEEKERRRLVVIEEWRASIQSCEFALPAGLIEDGEDPLACGVRELQEETGLRATWRGELSGRLFSSAGVTDESFAYGFFGCNGSPEESPGVDGEKIQVHLLDRAGCRQLLEQNRTGGSAVSGRLWPVLYSIAETGVFGRCIVD